MTVLNLGSPPPEVLERAFLDVRARIETRYAVTVTTARLEAPFTGDFDGAAIVLHSGNDPEIALFVLGHLFGHTVQWCTDPDLRALGLAYARSAPPPHLVEAVRRYEEDASRLALTLFHEAGVRALDGWLARWQVADWAYLHGFYVTGKRGDPRSFLRAEAAPLAALPIPEFTPTRFESRQAF